MKRATTRHLTVGAALAGLAIGAGTGCAPVPVATVDEGPIVAVTPNLAVRRMVWSPDATHLIYSWVEVPQPGSTGAANNGGIDVLDVVAGTSRRLVMDACCDPMPQVSGDGKTLYFVKPADGALRLLRVSLDTDARAAPQPVADHVASFQVAPDGHTVATGDWGSGPSLLIDAATGATQELGPGAPLAFSPDQRFLLVLVTGTDPSNGNPMTTYAVVDLADGTRQPIAPPGSGGLTVVSWDGARPRLILRDLVLIDLATGDQEAIGPGTQYAGLADPTLPLVQPRVIDWTEACLERHSDIAEKNYCVRQQLTLWRIDIASGATGVIAQDGSPASAVLSSDGHRLAIFDSGALHVKELP